MKALELRPEASMEVFLLSWILELFTEVVFKSFFTCPIFDGPFGESQTWSHSNRHYRDRDRDHVIVVF